MMKKTRLIISFLLFLSLLLPDAAYSPADAECAAARQYAPWQFAVISDTQNNSRENFNKLCINEEILKLIADDIAGIKPDFVLVSGDLVNGWLRNGGTTYATQYAGWKRSMKPVFKHGIKVYAVRGNHDSGPELLALPPLPKRLRPKPASIARLKKEFKKASIRKYTPLNGSKKERGLTYSFFHKNTRIIGLDQYSSGQHKINQRWLNRQLAKKKGTHLFLFGHEPAFGTDYNDNLSFYPGKRDLLWNSIGESGGRVYFCGHDHFYNRSLIQDNHGNPIWQIIGGTGGGKLQDWSGTYKEEEKILCEYHNSDRYGYMLVTIEGVKATIQWRALTDIKACEWVVLDSFTYSAFDASLQ